ncbi:MAG: SH3 domain-containing protein [Anaerolineae bacterium]|jgi:uncharacterized protein YraI|nr:SH3 domain-containing protein [Anaerolineae bacterium]
MHKWTRWISLLLLAGTTGLAVAQEAAACAALTADQVTAAAARCTGRGLDTLCVGSGPVQVGLAGGRAEFNPGDTLALDTVETLTTGAADVAAGTRGLALLNVAAGLNGAAVQMVLFGAATLTDAVPVLSADLPVLTVTSQVTYDVNLRQGAGTQYPLAGVLSPGASLTADGRSPEGAWLRVRTAAGAAWVSRELVQLSGDITALAPLASAYTAPMQAFVLQSAADDATVCGLDSSGLLLHTPPEIRAELQVNGLPLRLEGASLLVQANAAAGLRLFVLAGQVQAGPAGQTVGAGAGGWLQTDVDAATLLVGGTPQIAGQYPFAAVGAAPLQLMEPAALACIVGLPAAPQTAAPPGPGLSAYSGPGADYRPLAALEAQSHYAVTGFATASDGQDWWKLENNRWIPRDQVLSAGQCQAVERVAAPAITAAPPGSGSSLLPAETTIYQAESGPDVLTGQCNKPPLAICSHPAAVIPNPDGSFYWRGQEPEPYLMTPAGENRYTYSGRNYAGTANVSLALTFTGADTWQMTIATIFDDDPACTHTFYYTAVRR